MDIVFLQIQMFTLCLLVRQKKITGIKNLFISLRTKHFILGFHKPMNPLQNRGGGVWPVVVVVCLYFVGYRGSRFSNDPRDECAHAWPALAAVMVAVSCDPHSCLHLLDRVKILRHRGS